MILLEIADAKQYFRDDNLLLELNEVDFGEYST